MRRAKSGGIGKGKAGDTRRYDLGPYGVTQSPQQLAPTASEAGRLNDLI